MEIGDRACWVEKRPDCYGMCPSLGLSALDDHRGVSFACARELGTASPKEPVPSHEGGVGFLKWGIVQM